MVPLAVLLILALMVADWNVAGDSARQMLEERMANATSLAAQEVPFFLDAGQNLILQYAADERLTDEALAPEDLNDVLAQLLRSTPYFRQLFLLDDAGEPIAGSPYLFDEVYSSVEEQAGIELALNGVLIQAYTIQPADGDQSARVSFIVGIEHDETQRVLIGRTDLYSNPFAQSIIGSLDSMEDVAGEGYLLDDTGRVLYHPDPEQLWRSYAPPSLTEPSLVEDTAPDGARQLVYAHQAVGRPWTVVMTVPAQSAQQLAIDLAAPLLMMIFIIALVAFVIMRVGLRLVTSSLDQLAVQANRISQGELDQSLSVQGDDEVAQLSRSFEQMRIRLKARLQELNQLLEVSQGVAASLEMEEAVEPILKSALSTGAVAARVVLTPTILPDSSVEDGNPSRFSAGVEADLYAPLDEQILMLMQSENEIIVPNTNRSSTFTFSVGSHRPEALVALSLHHESFYYGVLWLAFNRSHNFTTEERRFLVTLAGQAALAASNAHLFRTAEIGRQRLEAILASTADPVLVTDHRNRLLLLNPAALLLFRMQSQSSIGQPIADVIEQPGLVDLMQISQTEEDTVEITLYEDRVYLATASSIMADDRPVGRVCILQDVTHFKELDALKTEFVATVSHDLRSPLTLMRGYATMLEMVGDLNSQQEGYVQKIVVGVESMSRLVNNLLDLGRIEADVGLRLEMLSVHDVIEQVTESLTMQAAQKQIQLHTSIPDEAIPLIEADQALLNQALHNLVENAIKYTPAKGDVHISVHVRQDVMVFEVKDNGIGVSPVDQPRLFERFYRSANREAKRERGTGLGLAIVKSIAERHGGQVGLTSQLGSGSTFYIAIPVRQPKE
jgi:signal transduction histidine kinase/HAMP domain-containing protein